MELQREQFDELLGGEEELPSSVSIIKFCHARSQEITALTEAIENPQHKHLAFQRMPKHLRRRAMSHTAKRLPRRLRDTHLSQMERSGLPVQGKRPSRKYRRRASQLQQAYQRRERLNTWLETHIWHAKRFHMTHAWSYKLPHFPNDKGFRACYRATAKHCLIQDLSYLNCIELRGPELDILQGLKELTSSECGLTFAAKSTLSGIREGSVMIFKRASYPFHAIGKVTFMWRPEVEDSNRTIWIWSHPGFYNEFLQELISVFEFEREESTEMEVDVNLNDKEECKLMDFQQKKTKIKQVKPQIKQIRKLVKFTNKKVVMISLKDTLNRFRLTGPLAQVVLTEALKFVDIDNFFKPDLNGEEMMDLDNEEKPRSAWLKDFYNGDNLECLKQQRSVWESILPDVNSADELPPRMILPVTVLDPRLTMPSTRIKAMNLKVTGSVVRVEASLCCGGGLWDSGLRDRVTHSKMAAAQLHKLQSRALVPGVATTSPLWIGRHNLSHLPLLLIQNPGVNGYGSGWDVVGPAGWGLELWRGLVWRGARPGGLRETQRLTLETLSGPTLPPDTQAAKLLSKKTAGEKLNKHFRLPPDKRPNYIKLGIVSPFQCPWEKLLQDWQQGSEDRRFFVIRNRVQLDFLNCVMNKTKPVTTCSFTEQDKACGLVQVGVEMCGRGTLGECAIICALDKKDLKMSQDKSGRGTTEPLHEDENEAKRKVAREAHLAKLKRLRKKRVRANRKLEEQGVFSIKTKTKKSPTEELVLKQFEFMKELWLPSEVRNVRNSSSRCIMGFVTCGDYSFTHSRSYGYGFVALAALLGVMERSQNLVLVRKVTSLQYYFARLKILRPA